MPLLLLLLLLVFKQVMYWTYLFTVCLWQGFVQGFSRPYIVGAESSIVATVTVGIETCGEVNVMASTWPLCTKARTLIFLIHNIYNPPLVHNSHLCTQRGKIFHPLHFWLTLSPYFINCSEIKTNSSTQISIRNTLCVSCIPTLSVFSSFCALPRTRLVSLLSLSSPPCMHLMSASVLAGRTLRGPLIDKCVQ